MVYVSDSRQRRADRMPPVRPTTLAPSKCESRTGIGWGNDSCCARCVDTTRHIRRFHVRYGIGRSDFADRGFELGRAEWRWTLVNLATNDHLFDIAMSEDDWREEGERKYGKKCCGFHP